MFFIEYIDPLIFLIAFAIGIFFTYILTPPPRIVIKYPNPHNIDDTTYVDDAGVCYKYKMKSVSCPRNKDDISEFEIQQD